MEPCPGRIDGSPELEKRGDSDFRHPIALRLTKSEKKTKTDLYGGGFTNLSERTNRSRGATGRHRKNPGTT
jgi:hypothetical protein